MRLSLSKPGGRRLSIWLSFQLSSFGVDYRFNYRVLVLTIVLPIVLPICLTIFFVLFAIFIFSWVGTTLHNHGIDHGLDLGSAIVVWLSISLSAGPWADCRPSFWLSTYVWAMWQRRVGTISLTIPFCWWLYFAKCGNYGFDYVFHYFNWFGDFIGSPEASKLQVSWLMFLDLGPGNPPIYSQTGGFPGSGVTPESLWKHT